MHRFFKSDIKKNEFELQEIISPTLPKIREQIKKIEYHDQFLAYFDRLVAAWKDGKTYQKYSHDLPKTRELGLYLLTQSTINLNEIKQKLDAMDNIEENSSSLIDPAAHLYCRPGCSSD